MRLAGIKIKTIKAIIKQDRRIKEAKKTGVLKMGEGKRAVRKGENAVGSTALVDRSQANSKGVGDPI